MAKPYGLLVAGFNFSNVAADEFNDWYDTEHVPERERVPGFINAQRWLGAEDAKISIAIYHLASPAVCSSPAWREAADTPWTLRIRPHTRDRLRVVLKRYTPGSSES